MHRFILLSALLFASVNLQANTQDLSLRLEVGQEFRQYMYNSSLISQSFRGNEIDIELSMESEMYYKVLAVLDEGYELEVRFDQLVMSSVFPFSMEKISYSSGDESSDHPISGLLDRLVGKPFIIRISGKGALLEISQSGHLMQEIRQTDAESLGLLASQFRQAFDEGSIMGNFGLFIRLPEHAVGLGDSWDGSYLLSSAYPIHSVTTYTLVAVTEDTFIIRGNALLFSSEETWENVSGFDMKLSGDMISEIVLSKETGFVQSASHIQDIRGDGALQGSGQHADPMTVHIHNSIQITVD